MEKNYKRADNIDEIIHSVKLPYLAWKVLFLIGEQMETKKILEILEESEKNIADALSLLENEKLIVSETVEDIVVDEPVIEEEGALEEVVKTEEPLESEAAMETVLQEDKDSELIADIEEGSVEEDVSEADLLGDVGEAVVEEQEEAAPEINIAGEEERSKEEKPAAEEVAEQPQDAIQPIEEEATPVGEEDETIDLGIDFSSQEETKQEVAQTEEDKALPKSGQTTILVIDDSIVIRKMVEIALEDVNFHIESAANGKAGLEMVDKVDPKLVIVDLMLPDINGIDILKTIKASKGIPIIMLSGKDTPQMIEKAKAEGADEFLPKPFKDEELVEKINALLK